MEEIIRLNLASGKQYLDGYWNVDNLSMNPNVKVDEVANILTYHDYDDNFHNIEEIRLSHFMMYVLPDEALFLFNRWWNWLKKGGKLIIETSDAQKIAKMIIKDDEMVEQMFGYGDTKGHRWSYTPKTLEDLLRIVGFRKFEILEGGSHNRPDRDFTITAWK